MQKAKELYDGYYEVFFQFNQKLEEARSLLPKCKEDVVYGGVNKRAKRASRASEPGCDLYV